MINIHDLSETVEIVDMTDSEASQVAGGSRTAANYLTSLKLSGHISYKTFVRLQADDEFLSNLSKQLGG